MAFLKRPKLSLPLKEEELGCVGSCYRPPSRSAQGTSNEFPSWLDESHIPAKMVTRRHPVRLKAALIGVFSGKSCGPCSGERSAANPPVMIMSPLVDSTHHLGPRPALVLLDRIMVLNGISGLVMIYSK